VALLEIALDVGGDLVGIRARGANDDDPGGPRVVGEERRAGVTDRGGQTEILAGLANRADTAPPVQAERADVQDVLVVE